MPPTPTEARFVFGACYAALNGGELTVGNDHVERRWRVAGDGLLHPTSLRDKSVGHEWLATGTVVPPSPSPPFPVPLESRPVTLTATNGRARVTEEPSLLAVLTAVGPSATLTYRFKVFPNTAGIATRLAVTASQEAHRTEWTARGEIATIPPPPTGVEQVDAARKKAPDPAANDALDVLTLAPLHLRLIQVTFHDQTDSHNELVQETEWRLHTSEGPLSLAGNLFVVEDVLTRAGLIFLKEAPLPYARPVPTPVDFHVRPAERRFALLGHGVDAGGGGGGGGGAGYGFVTLAYSGGVAGRTAALQAYQRQTRAFDPARDAMLLSNTWGDRGQDARISHEFLTREIEAGARLGVDVVQIDDGWQKGRTSNSVVPGGVWEGFRKSDPEFWLPHPTRFPHGLAPLIEAARAKGMRFGLWFAPDSTDDFAHWEADADTLLRLHRDHSVDYFKIDGVKMRTKKGEHNLRAFFDRVLERSGGRIVFDSDVTAEVRPGYWGLMDTGPLFVENRYTDSHRYWPHATLRNLWKLAHYIDPARLRMEWLNNARNTEKYAGDPLAPAAYRPDYLFATVMFSSPLGWFEVSHLPEAYFERAAPLIALWKRHRAALFSGTMLPLGDAPDGASWTGFASRGNAGGDSYALVFREHNDVSEQVIPVHGGGRGNVETLAGDGHAAWAAPGMLRVRIDAPLRYAFLRWKSSG